MAPLASFGKYLLTDKLATGGMAEIYRGKLLGPGGFEKLLVIKQIHPELARHQQFVEMFVAEAKTTVSLSHGNIVPVYELGVVDGTYFIAMEFVDGVTLTELVAGARATARPLSPPEACYLVSEILKGLDYAHRKGGGIIHRDLSTRNIMVSRDGEVKILDFGLAATLEGAAAASAATSGGGRPVGSFPYMSPEQAAREPIDPRTDIFTCGILLWEMLTGTSLFGRATDEETIAAVRCAQVPPPSTLAADVPAELERACLRALEADPARRFPDAGAFLGALGRYLYRLEPPITPGQIADLVATTCPPHAVPPPPAARSRGDDDAATRAAERGGPATRPMEGRRTTGERSFATNVFLSQILAQDPADDADGAPPIAPVDPEPPTRHVLLVVLVLLGGALALVGWLALSAPDDAPPTPALAAVGLADARSPGTDVPAPAVDAAAAAGLSVDAAREPTRARVRPDADVRPRAADAATPTPAAPPDGARPPVGPIGPRSVEPAGTGTLRLGLKGAPWATVELGGQRLGRAPLETRVPAGRHQLTVACDPEVCPPRGLVRTITVEVPAGGLAKEIVDLTSPR